MIRHNWRETDDALLLQAVDVVSGLATQLKPRVKLWSAVSGRLMPDLVVTADACRSRFERLQRLALDLSNEKAALTGSHDDRVIIDSDAEAQWDAVTKQVEQFEQDWDDLLVETLCGIRDSVTALDARLSSIEAEQRRLRALWE